MEGLGRKAPVRERGIIMEEMVLFDMMGIYPSKLKLTIIDNGETIFNGILGCMAKYVNAENLARKAHIYISELDYSANVYLQRR